jgi:hypothetical protein
MNQEIKDKLAKIYELVNRGATEGERAAAKTALDKLMKKYNLSDEVLSSIHLNKYQFKYASNIEFKLLAQIFKLHTTYDISRITRGVKCLYNQLTYIEYVTANCMYEYYRRHAKVQWNKFCKPELAKCRKAKTKAIRRSELQEVFISNYIIASKLYQEQQLIEVDNSKLRKKQLVDGYHLRNVEGGVYNQQLHSNLLLD